MNINRQKKLPRKEKLIAQVEQHRSNPESVSTFNKFKSLNFSLGLVVALIAFGLYINTLGNDFVYDDVSIITKNPLVGDGFHSIPDLLKTSYYYGFNEGKDAYRPIPMIIFATVWQFFPNNPFPGHLINVLLYALTGFFLFKLLRKLLTSYSIVVPFIATLLFIVHPIHTEVVANIKSLDEILSFLFAIFSLLFILRYIEKGVFYNILFALCCFFLALLSKESAVLMFLIIPLTLYFFIDIPFYKLIRIMLMFSIPLVIYLYIRGAVIGSVTTGRQILFIDNILVDATNILTRLATAFYILAKQIQLFIFPYPLSSDYSYKQLTLTGWDNPIAIISLIFYMSLFTYALFGVRKKNVFAYCILFYLITIAIASNIFFLIATSFAERLLYVPLLGFTLSFAIIIAKIFNNALPDNIKTLAEFIKSKRKTLVVLGILLIPMSLKTISRNRDWKSDYLLFNADVNHSPQSARLRCFHADKIIKEKVLKSTNENEKSFWLDSALAEYNRSIEFYPSYAYAYGQRGYVFYLKNNKIQEYEDYKKSIELKTNIETTYCYMGYHYTENGEHEKALGFYLKSIELNPRYMEAWRQLGITYYILKEYDKAINAFLTTLTFNPDDPTINNIIGKSYQAIGDSLSAQKYFEKANRLDATQVK